MHIMDEVNDLNDEMYELLGPEHGGDEVQVDMDQDDDGTGDGQAEDEDDEESNPEMQVRPCCG